jgi:amino acid permease
MSIQARARAILDAKDSTEEYKSIDIVFPLLIAFIAVALSLAKDQKDLGGIVQLFLSIAIAYFVYLLALLFVGWLYTNPRIKLIEALAIIANETTKEEQHQCD